MGRTSYPRVAHVTRMDWHQHLGFLLDDVAYLYARRFEEHARGLSLTLHQCDLRCPMISDTVGISSVNGGEDVKIRSSSSSRVQPRDESRPRSFHGCGSISTGVASNPSIVDATFTREKPTPVASAARHWDLRPRRGEISSSGVIDHIGRTRARFQRAICGSRASGSERTLSFAGEGIHRVTHPHCAGRLARSVRGSVPQPPRCL
jgi:hypothetical protein